MAAPSATASVELAESTKCFMHLESVQFEKVKPLTQMRWNKFTTCAKIWLPLSGRDRVIAENAQRLDLLDLPFHEACLKQPDLGFHDTCYRRFIDGKRINAGKKRKSEEDPGFETHEVSPKKLRPRSSSASSTVSSSSGVLPPRCIICSKVELYITQQGKRVKDKLIQAETFDGGMLRQAAESKRDENILIHIRHKDCVALEVRYHTSCYKNYTRFVTRSKPTEGKDSQVEYQRGYDMFCASVIQQRLIDNEEIMRMSKLTQLFVKMVRTHEGTELGSYRSDKLKYRLKRDFPQLCFHKPFRRNKCEIVYTATLSAGSVAECQDSSEGSSEDSSSDTMELGCETGASLRPSTVTKHVDASVQENLIFPYLTKSSIGCKNEPS